MSTRDISTEKVLAMIADSIADVGADRVGTEPIAFSESMPLFGAGSPLDSLEFVNFIAGLEQRIEMASGVSVNLTALMFDAGAGNPFRSASTLATRVVDLAGTASR